MEEKKYMNKERKNEIYEQSNNYINISIEYI